MIAPRASLPRTASIRAFPDTGQHQAQTQQRERRSNPHHPDGTRPRPESPPPRPFVAGLQGAELAVAGAVGVSFAYRESSRWTVTASRTLLKAQMGGSTRANPASRSSASRSQLSRIGAQLRDPPPLATRSADVLNARHNQRSIGSCWGPDHQQRLVRATPKARVLRIAETCCGLRARGSGSRSANATGATLASAPSTAIKRVGMARVVRMAVKLIGAGIRLDESTVGKTCLAEHPSIRDTVRIGTEMTAGHSGGDAIGVKPPRGLAWYPIIRLELDRAGRTWNLLSARGWLCMSTCARQRHEQEARRQNQSVKTEHRNLRSRWWPSCHLTCIPAFCGFAFARTPGSRRQRPGPSRFWCPKTWAISRCGHDGRCRAGRKV